MTASPVDEGDGGAPPALRSGRGEALAPSRTRRSERPRFDAMTFATGRVAPQRSSRDLACRSTGMERARAVTAVVSLTAERGEAEVLDRAVRVAREMVASGCGVAMLKGPDRALSGVVHGGPPQAPTTEPLRAEPGPGRLVELLLDGVGQRLPEVGAGAGELFRPAAEAVGPFLGVPVAADGAVLGAIYLTRSPGGAPFEDADELLVQALADQAGAMVQGLRDQRATGAVIGRLNAPSRTDRAAGASVPPLVPRLLAAARDVLSTDLTFLSRFDGAQQHFTHVDRGPGAPPLAEGSTVDADDGYCTLMLTEQIPSAVPDVAAHPLLAAMPVTAELGVGAYCGVPVRLPDGTVHGTLCGLSSRSGCAPTAVQLEAMHLIAELIGVSLAQQQHDAAGA